MAFFAPIIIEDENSQVHPSHRIRILLLIGMSFLITLGFFALYLSRSGNNLVFPNNSSGIMPIYLMILVFSAIVLFMVIFSKILRFRSSQNSQKVGISSIFHEHYEEPISEQSYRQSSRPKCYSCGEFLDMTTIERSQNQTGIYCPSCGVYIDLR